MTHVTGASVTSRFAAASMGREQPVIVRTELERAMEGTTMKRRVRNVATMLLLAVGLIAGPTLGAASVASASASAAAPGIACC